MDEKANYNYSKIMTQQYTCQENLLWGCSAMKRIANILPNIRNSNSLWAISGSPLGFAINVRDLYLVFLVLVVELICLNCAVIVSDNFLYEVNGKVQGSE